MLNRTQSPEIQQVSNLKLPMPQTFTMGNGIPVYVTNMGTQDVVKIEVVFRAGRPYEGKKLAARATAALLKEGTKNYSSAQIAEEVDFYGSTLSIPVNLDTSNVILFSLTKHLDKSLPLLCEVLSSPIFPENELAAYVDRSKRRLQVDLTRNDVVAYRKITEFIFGENNPYGYNSNKDIYESISQDDLLAHFNRNYVAENCTVFVSGRITDKHLQLITQQLGKVIRRGKKSKVTLPENEVLPQKIFIPMTEDSVQTAIRVGRRLFNRTHPDFKGMYVLNTVLGGYFGSRLMANIREEKGYTYNVFSTMDSMLFDGCFYVGTEVGNEFVEATKKEIYLEFEKLQNERIAEEELTMVRNYLLGNLLTSLDGPFAVSDVVKTLVMDGLQLADFQNLVDFIKNISADELQRLAQKYLKKEDMWEVIVGSKG